MPRLTRVWLRTSLSCLISGVVGLAAAQYPTAPVPVPSGRYAVGTAVLPVEKSEKAGTHRQVQLWYPAPRGSRRPRALYVPNPQTMAVARREKLLEQTPNVYDAWQTMKLSAALGAPILNTGKRWPLVVVMPGLGMPAFCYTSYAQQLASDGYIVATVDFSSGGFLVQGLELLDETPKGDDEAVYGKIAEDWAVHVSEILDQVASPRRKEATTLVSRIFARIDPTRIAAIGHSEGGAAALEAARTDKRVKACVDLDGIPLGHVAEHGIETAALMLRSHVDYSDDDLARLKRTRAEWDARGAKTKAGLQKLIDGPGGDVWILSVNGTNHISYSDCPFVMPQAISHWGGRIIDPNRLMRLWTRLVEGYFEHCFGSKATFQPALAPEVTLQMSRTKR